MFYSKFTIKNFKCFERKQTLLLAVPMENKIGSGLTYIVGSNNAGKTTVIEGLAIKDGRNIKTSERVTKGNPEFVLFEGDKIIRKSELIRPESSTIKEDPKIQEVDNFYIISSRRHWNSSAGSKYSNVGDSFRSTFEFSNRQNNLEVGSELRSIEANEEKYQRFIKLVQRVIPEFTKFTVAFEDNHYIEYISKSGIRHKTDFLGDGVIAVIRILLQVFVLRNNPIIIDEPELSLHPPAQRQLLRVLAEFSQTRQILISTHSPYFIDWEYLHNGAVLNRVVKENDRRTIIFSIPDFTKYDRLIRTGNWQMPFAMDEVAKEIFFMGEGMLFLEGQEDVGLLRREPTLGNINIFGYGVRGKDNFKFALTLAKDLGYKKVSCILDNGASESKIKRELKASFPDYKIVQWNKNDIRDKKSTTSVEKSGYFNKKGMKKPDAQLDDFNLKLSEIKTYLGQDVP